MMINGSLLGRVPIVNRQKMGRKFEVLGCLGGEKFSP